MMNTLTIPGVFLEINSLGTLIIGPSGIGKSRLGLSLIHRGHRLVADDAVTLTKSGQKLIGTCSPISQDFLHLRDLGIMNVRKMFGDGAVCSSSVLEFVIQLTTRKPEIPMDMALTGLENSRTFMSIEIQEQIIFVDHQQDLVALIEASVRKQQLKQSGYSASADFIARQQRLMDSD